MSSAKQSGRILVIGALGQIGQELTEALRQQHAPEAVIAADIQPPKKESGPFELLDVCDRASLFDLIERHQIRTVYNLAAILSARGEQDPQRAWQINMEGLLNTLEAARQSSVQRLFWPSSIAVFGPDSPKLDTPQVCIMNPSTVYGISKLAGERWCEYYADRYGVDVRSLRYPGLIGYKSLPGGGTTDYAVEIFHAAAKREPYTCFLAPDTALPMMYMPDAIRATLALMEAPAARIRVRSAYNLGGISFTPQQLLAEIQALEPDFVCHYAPDFRQAIADSWPASIDDQAARKDWDWQSRYDLPTMAREMLSHIRERYAAKVW